MILAQPSWRTYGEAARLSFAATTLRKTNKIALVVGTLLSLINQGTVVFGGHATAVTCRAWATFRRPAREDPSR
jgi:hypothetical protein